MRMRTTWNRNVIKASLNKKADPFQMNQEHKQPATDAYMNGSPSEWAEDVHSPNDWEKEYANGQTKRDEVGLPEMKKEALLKKADLCVSVAKLVLKKATEAAVEDQAFAFMDLSDQNLIETYTRLANEDQSQQSQQDEAKQAQDQQQQTQQEPPKEAQAQQDQQQQAPAGEQKPTAAEQCMQAQAQGDMEGMKAALQQMVMEAVQQSQAPKEQAPAAPMQAQASKKKAEEQAQQQAPAQAQEEKKEASPAPVASQDLSAMIATAVANALAAQQGQQDQGQAPVEEHQAQQDQQQQSQDDLLLDDMLSQDPGQQDMTAGGEIELSATGMDFGAGDLGPEDEALKQLFATEETRVATTRTAATRTLGTKPSNGVSKLGGGFNQSKTASASDESNNLSALWVSAPDVREHFGIK